MKIGDKEKKFLLLIGVVIYAYFFIQFNLNKSIPSIKTNNIKIAKAQSDLDALKKDLLGINDLERTVTQLITANERYSDFIAQNAEIVDTMEYVEKLKKLFNDKITGVSFEAPKDETQGGNKYYSFTTNFKSKLNISELNALSSFIEGGAKKVKITKLNITPSMNQKENGDKKATIDQQDIEFNMDISITMYSLELGSVEKLYEMSRKKLETFIGTDGIVFAPSSNLSVDAVTVSLGGEKTPPPAAGIKKPDIGFSIYSFFSGGSNFIMTGNKFGNREFANFKTSQRQLVTLSFNDYIYSMDCTTTSGKKVQFSGKVPNRDMYVSILAQFPQIIENKDLGADIKIINSSEHNISVYIEGRKEKIQILDRNGAVIKSKSLTDKIYIV